MESPIIILFQQKISVKDFKMSMSSNLIKKTSNVFVNFSSNINFELFPTKKLELNSIIKEFSSFVKKI